MKKKVFIYTIIGLAALVFIVMMIAIGYNNQGSKRTKFKADARLSLGYRDKSVYGGYIAYKLLPGFFGGLPLRVVTKPFTKTYSKDTHMSSSAGSAYILTGRHIYTSTQDVADMLSYVEAGNQLFVAAESIDSLFMDTFGFTDSLKVTGSSKGGAQHFVNRTFRPAEFSYNGRMGNNYIASLDTAVSAVLGVNDEDHTNFVRITRGNGQVFVSLNPYIFTNYFLSTGSNEQALAHMMAYMRAGVGAVFWDEYYKHLSAPQSGDFSNWQVLMRYPSMRWAFLLALLLMILFAVFEGKRRQRIIPPKPPVVNTSLEFVKTLGKLYFAHHNNLNLANKMIVHLLEFVRTQYNLNTNVLDADFIHRLSRKSGHKEEEVERMIRMVDHIRLSGSITDDELKAFYKSIYHFYLKTN